MGTVRSTLCLVLVCLGLAACVPSLNPLYDDKTLVSLPQLEGAWKASESSDQFVFTRDASAVVHRMVHIDARARSVAFQAAGVRLGDALYLDFVPDLPAAYDGNDFLSRHVTVWHSFGKLQITQNELRLRMADPAWMTRYIAAHPDALAHFTDQGMVYVTADTASLQAFVAAHDEMFDTKEIVFTRE